MPGFNGLFKAKQGYKISMEDEIWLKLLLLPNQFFCLCTSKCWSLLKAKPGASQCRHSGQTAWVSSRDAQLFPICTLILCQAPTWSASVQRFADISIYTGGGESWGIWLLSFRNAGGGGGCLIPFRLHCVCGGVGNHFWRNPLSFFAFIFNMFISSFLMD